MWSFVRTLFTSTLDKVGEYIEKNQESLTVRFGDITPAPPSPRKCYDDTIPVRMIDVNKDDGVGSEDEEIYYSRRVIDLEKPTNLVSFSQKQEYLVKCVDATANLARRMEEYNKKRWVIAYPNDKNIVDLKGGVYDEENLILESLESVSIGNLLDLKFSEAIGHLVRLKGRVMDHTSKILVTGDVNSGKSTLINAMLQRELLPIDQQPNTNAFCEIVSAKLNDDKEELHANIEGENKLFEIEEAQEILEKDDIENAKIYARDLFLHNEAFDITLIDSPGLNIDSLNTMSLVAKQDDIDIVVFVVNAANHLTLSARDFLKIVSKEKLYIFIVVNKFDEIKNKEKCKQKILKQIQDILPQTFQTENLIHFISAKEALIQRNFEMNRLISGLQEFTLEKRTISKLSPAKTYATHVLSDIRILAEFNQQRTLKDANKLTSLISQETPVFEAMKKGIVEFDEYTNKITEQVSTMVETKTNESFNKFLGNLESYLNEIPCYAQDSIHYLNSVASSRLKNCHQFSLNLVSENINKLHHKLAQGFQHPIPKVQSFQNFPPFLVDEESVHVKYSFGDTLSALASFENYTSIASFLSFGASVAASSYRMAFLMNFKSSKTIIFAATGVFIYKSSDTNNHQKLVLAHYASRCVKFAAWEMHKFYNTEIINAKAELDEKLKQLKYTKESLEVFNQISQDADDISFVLSQVQL
ncbi:Transmembrane GTPase Fzo/Fzo1/Marf domain-containing protein [Rozella allomycis CSF55]|uniref:Transmembrane GTPase Fzo/Fzo1/Marf domain-containing protein n=1 Tax=Rozella allomycis (strain CSF55) TaxID=988480 RepID=A0A075B251_ROZAC|nr:Transmembrane GTPase Fzo/Fzo1/Marf domain-containing protein [Rozella allomycis CSF55]|eukprot:EPZ36640.1 Transmembrane GTPase Fzo/Fzo1/Marf domain-containing protein [Rozella allomycis CSF55]